MDIYTANWVASGPILALLSPGHQLAFDHTVSDGSWTLLPLMKSVSKEGFAMSSTAHFGSRMPQAHHSSCV